MSDLETEQRRRRTPDLFTMAIGVGALGVAGVAFFGGIAWLPTVDVRWVLAGIAVLIGLLLVVGSMRPRG